MKKLIVKMKKSKADKVQNFSLGLTELLKKSRQQ